MKKLLASSLGVVLASMYLTMSAFAAEYLLQNGDFEEGPGVEGSTSWGAVPGWLNFGGVQGNNAIVGAPGVGPQQGNYAVQLSFNNPSITEPFINNVTFLFQRLDINPKLGASPGDEFYASAHVLREIQPGQGFSLANFGISFFDDSGHWVEDMAPASISKGNIGGCPWPGVGVNYDPNGPLNSWQFMQAQAVAASAETILVDCMVKAPADAVEVGLFLISVNSTEAPAPVWFDNVILARLQPDDDDDRLQNSVDSDPLNDSSAFSDGATSGEVIADDSGILDIDDEPFPDGVRITSDPGQGSPGKVRMCNNSAILSIRPNSELVTTCGSVIVKVELGSEPVDMDIVLNGQNARVTVPAEAEMNFDPESGTLGVASTSTNPQVQPIVVLTIGNSTIPIAPNETIALPTMLIDIQPGSDLNCLNINGRGVIPVAILGSETLDIDDIDQSTLTLSGLGVRTRGNGAPSCGTDDTNADGFTDLVCSFDDDLGKWEPGSASATLSGLLLNGTPVSGTDSICRVP